MRQSLFFLSFDLAIDRDYHNYESCGYDVLFENQALSLLL